MSLLFSDMSILLGWNIVLGLAAVSGTGWIISRGSMVGSRCTFPSDLVSGLLNPRTNPGEACRRDPGDITRDVPQRSRRILRPRAEIKRRQALQKRHCAAFGHPRISIDHDVFPQSSRVRFVTEEGQRNSRISPDVLDLLVHSQMEMAYHELVALNSDPHDGDLRAAVVIERGQMGERSFFDHSRTVCGIFTR